MKKILAIILCALTLASIVSCDNGKTDAENTNADDTSVSDTANNAVKDADTTDIMNACVAAYDAKALPTLQYYLSTAGEDDPEYLEPGFAGVLFYDEYGADISVLESLDSYSMATPIGKRIFEIDIMKVKSANDIEAATQLLNERFNRKNNGDIINYAPEEDPYLKETDIFNIGNYVVLLSTLDNTLARGVIENMLGA